MRESVLLVSVLGPLRRSVLLHGRRFRVLAAVAAVVLCSASIPIAQAADTPPSLSAAEVETGLFVVSLRNFAPGAEIETKAEIAGGLGKTVLTTSTKGRAAVLFSVPDRFAGPVLITATGPDSVLTKRINVSVSSATPTTAAPTTTTAPVAAASEPLGMGGTWKSIFADEFSGASLDTSKWSTGWLANGITQPVNPWEGVCYDPKQVTTTGGQLHLTVVAQDQTCGGKSRSYSSGLIHSKDKFGFTYGAMEARIYVPAASNGSVANWPAFWANGNSWPTDGEIDVFEGLSGQAAAHFHSPSGGPGVNVPGTWTGWHTFAAHWEPGKVSYFWDGKKVGEITQAITGAPMYLILNNSVDGNKGTAPADMAVDYVRVWQKA